MRKPIHKGLFLLAPAWSALSRNTSCCPVVTRIQGSVSPLGCAMLRCTVRIPRGRDHDYTKKMPLPLVNLYVASGGEKQKLNHVWRHSSAGVGWRGCGEIPSGGRRITTAAGRVRPIRP